jgi:lipoprotein-anchoring transpeptidase ErfK/SrfK
MRNSLVAAVLGICLGATCAFAQQLRFPPETFEIVGGLEVGNVAAPVPSKPDSLRRVVEFATDLPPGSIVVRTGERRLYYVMPEGKAIQYPVGVGREGFTWSGTDKITRKAMWPDWHPPKEMIRREARRGRVIPAFMAGGPENPLGARALYIGNTEYRIHGTSQPWTVGLASSSGCIRMLNEQVIDLYARVEIGATVLVQ